MNWENPSEHVSKYFQVKECLWLPKWNRLANESDGLTDEIKQNLVDLCEKMDRVREFFGKPLAVHCCLRPPVYNKLIGGATHSAHLSGKALDFDVVGMDCEEAKLLILQDNKLDLWDLRMEKGTKGWIHLGNDYKPGHDRYFLP